ncbi:ATP-binding protein [Desulfobotulus sp.]|uniref:hybrid sensor histidine kinase/response regulator n=1 Tax=Desulfobotulus sp. TaxID=1940337 RepID=UPI002A35F940|nr:ATP-binding protein [Desulfobotulus sp.]MDY0162648.1 ATP-binding protein [Desulfobotulus sp.]
MNFFSKDFLLTCAAALGLSFLGLHVAESLHSPLSFLLPTLCGLIPWAFYQFRMAKAENRLQKRIQRRDRRFRAWLFFLRQREEALLGENRPLLLMHSSGRILKASAEAIRITGQDPSGSFISQLPGAGPGPHGGTLTSHVHPEGKRQVYWMPLQLEGRRWRVGLDVSTYMERETRLKAEADTFRGLAEQRADQLMILHRRLRQSGQMVTLGRLSAGISHDFNNILSSIMGAAQMAELCENEKRRTHHLNTIFSAGYRARDLVQQILTFSRPEGPTHHAFSLKPILTESLRLIRAALPAHIAIRYRNGAMDACIEGNPTRIHQLLINLMTNACHAMEENGGILTLEIEEILPMGEQEQGWTRISVKDTGHGIPENIRHRIFEPFFTTRLKEEGNGMGLSQVQDIVEEHGGRMRVESQAGAGAVFRVDLPLAQKKAPPVLASPPPEAGKGHILWVDDEKEIGCVGKEMLEHLGYAVTTASNAREAMICLEKTSSFFDAIISDYAMPETNGLKLAWHIRRTQPDLPIILTTGCPHWLPHPRNEFVDFVLEKPFTLQTLALALQKVQAPKLSSPASQAPGVLTG